MDWALVLSKLVGKLPSPSDGSLFFRDQFSITSQSRFLCHSSPGYLNPLLRLKWEVSHEICGGYNPDVLFSSYFASGRTEGSFFSVFILSVLFPRVKRRLVFSFDLCFQKLGGIKRFLRRLSNFTRISEALCVNLAQKDPAWSRIKKLLQECA